MCDFEMILIKFAVGKGNQAKGSYRLHKYPEENSDMEIPRNMYHIKLILISSLNNYLHP